MFSLATICLGAGSFVAGGEPVDFQRDVRPILADKCYQCHGPDAEHREAGLRLDVAPRAGDDQAVVPGKPADSELIRRITSEAADERMPPAKSGKSLTIAEVATLRRWIDEGAKWSMHWAYVAPVRHEPPAVKDAAWSSHWIDRFLMARFERAGISPSPPADRVTLIRRLSLDLRGLPPTYEDVDAFVRDEDAKAVERVIDRYLADDAYGERMASYWLDLVRFADTVGYHGDQEHHITPYRDWVIDAFIADKPFDEFTREQLAGDLIPGSNVDQKIASGYNRLLQTSHEGGVQAKEYLAMYAADRIRNLSGVWMGATVGCAQCHSHKFDPYTHTDFYSLAAFFSDLDEAAHLKKGSDSNPTVRAPELKVHTKRERARLAELEASISALKQADGKSETDSSPSKTLAELEAEKGAIEKSARLTMVSAAIEPRVVRVLPRGNWLDESGPVVEPAVPMFLGRLNVGDRRATRFDLARWLTDPKDGAGLLTARVMVNRLWYLMFGSGLSRSLEDFGGQGEAPDHPELLDRLAWELVEQNWRIKPVLKQIAMSRAYQQSSEIVDFGSRIADSPEPGRNAATTSSNPQSAIRSPQLLDPDNRLFARQGRFRLPAEAIRDNALAISGLLVRDLGGPSVRPYQPERYYQHLNFPKRDYKADTDSRQWRRGLYVHWQRQFLHPMMKAFDAPRREECNPQRPRSNTPLAALTLLNDPTFVEAARVFAAHTLASGKTEEERLDFAFRQAVSRRPDEAERAILQRLLADSRRETEADAESATKLTAIGVAPRNHAESATEIAAWTTVCRAILNLSETITRR